MEFIGGSKGLLGMHAPLLVQVPSFSYSFQQKSCQIIVFFSLILRVGAPIWEILNPPLELVPKGL